MPVTLESNSSNPFVVITNECQYEEADGLLMRSDVFGPQVYLHTILEIMERENNLFLGLILQINYKDISLEEQDKMP